MQKYRLLSLKVSMLTRVYKILLDFSSVARPGANPERRDLKLNYLQTHYSYCAARATVRIFSSTLSLTRRNKVLGFFMPHFT